MISPITGWWAGCWAEHEQKYDEAARAFWEAVRLDSSGYPEALPNLLFALKQLNRDKEANEVAAQINRATLLSDCVKTHLERGGSSQSAAFSVSDAMLSMGRSWEAEGWARLAISLSEDKVNDTRERYLKVRSTMTAQSPWQSPEFKLANGLDLSDLPPVSWGASSVKKFASRGFAKGEIHFKDEASARGLDSTSANLRPPVMKQAIGFTRVWAVAWESSTSTSTVGLTWHWRSSMGNRSRTTLHQIVFCETWRDNLQRSPHGLDMLIPALGKGICRR